MAKQAIVPTSILNKVYFDASLTAAQLTSIVSLVSQSGVTEEEGSLKKVPLYYSTDGENHPAVLLGLEEFEDGYLLMVITHHIEVVEEEPAEVSIDYMFNTSDTMASLIEKNKWFLQTDEGELEEVTGEQEITIGAIAAGETSCPIGDAIVNITEEHNEAVKDLVYIKGTDPEPTTEDERLKTYMARLKKFITLQQGKKISQGE